MSPRGEFSEEVGEGKILEEYEWKAIDELGERTRLRDPYTAMVSRFNLVLRWFARRYFSHFELDAKVVEQLREMENRGSVVYVMRYSSRLDYFLFNTLFAREGLRLSSFANGIHFHYFGRILSALRTTFSRDRRRSSKDVLESDRDYARRLSLGGQSFFLFLRTARLKTFLRGRKAAQQSHELNLVEEVVRTVWDTDRPVFVVPVALFWRKGPRAESRFLNLSYGALTRPSDLAKVSSFLATYQSLSVKVGEAIDLQQFIAGQRAQGPARVARKVRRSILIYLFREEKVVEGPALRSRQRVHNEVLADPGVGAAMRERAEERGWPRARVQAEADKMISEIAAAMNSTTLAVMNTLTSWLFRKLFSSIEIYGLETVAENVKRRPVILVPSHRSYFDFLILSVLLYGKYMMPPHIAARDNMAFGPFGFLFRRVGAFFMRKNFDDALYKEIFRSYVGYLVREGFTQEFFIEGGRSRTGKTLAPRLGMLTWDVDAFIDSHQRDLCFIPVAITYERLVEESSMLGELDGDVKTEESMLNLMRARKYLQRKFGSAHVCFGEPISLAECLGDRRDAFRDLRGDEVELLEEKRALIEDLGWNIVEQINWTFVANSTSVAACALMGSPSRGILRADLIQRMQEIVDLLKIQKTRLTKALTDDQGDFEESISFLLRSDLIHSRSDARGEILYFEESRRIALDLYRNSIVHFLAVPSFMARSLLAGFSVDGLQDELNRWLELFYQEFYLAKTEVVAARFDAFLSHFVARGWLRMRGDRWVPTATGNGVLANLAEQTRGVIDVYIAACDAASQLEGQVTHKEFYLQIAASFENAELLGTATRPESANDVAFSNAADLLVKRGALEAHRRDVLGKKGKKQGKVLRTERVLGPADDGERLAEIRSELTRLDSSRNSLH